MSSVYNLNNKTTLKIFRKQDNNRGFAGGDIGGVGGVGVIGVVVGVVVVLPVVIFQTKLFRESCL